MSIAECSVNTSQISALANRPVDAGGLTAAEFKAKFDAAGAGIKNYINETLVEAVNDLQSDVSTAQGDIDELEEDSHTHSNKALLDTYDQTNANITDAVSKKHEHSNKAVLDGITATAEDLNKTSNYPALASASAAFPLNRGGTGATTADAALAALGGIKIVKLWTNENPTSSFDAQPVSVDLSGYDLVLITANSSTSSPKEIFALGRVGKTANLSNSENHNAFRHCTISETSVTFSDGSWISAYGQDATTNNSRIVPVAIYGIKGVQE